MQIAESQAGKPELRVLSTPKAVFDEPRAKAGQAGRRYDPSACHGAGEWKWDSYEHAGQYALKQRGWLRIESVPRLQKIGADAARKEASDRCQRNRDPKRGRFFRKKKPVEAHDQ